MRRSVWCWLASLWSLSLADNASQPISIFRSRPDLVSPILTVFERVAEKQAPGYYFVAPYQQIQESVHIYDNDANLVWTGFGAIGPGIVHAPQTCQYHGETHLCFYQGTQMVGWGHGHGIIMDKHYRVVKSVEPGSYQASSDMHEFRLTKDGKSALMTQYLRSVYDLCAYDLCDGLGYIQQGAFQEVEVDTGKVLFEWRSLDHVDPAQSYVRPGTTEISGSGENPESPWDYFHINSIDKNEDGDYLISARHVSAVYKISGKDGHIIWTLNGAKSDYYLNGFAFSFQHDARFVSESDDETVISLFDNGSNGFNQTQPYSTGQIIQLNHKTKVATALLDLAPPLTDGQGHMSKSQGSFQRLDNGNMLMGWGNHAFWTEYASDGEIVFYGNLAWSNVMNYRVHKFDNWVGLPLTKPALWTYSQNGLADPGMYFYASWNGATEVKHWNFYTSSAKNGPWEKVTSVPKAGFETIYRYPGYYQYAYAEALDANLQVLSRSEAQQTFVPNARMSEFCDALACRFMPNGEEREKERQQKADAQRAKEAEEQREKEAARIAAEQARERREKRNIIIGSSLGGLAVVVIVIFVLSTRNFISRPVHRLARKGWTTLQEGGKGKAEPRYAVLEEQEGDRAPMITDPS